MNRHILLLAVLGVFLLVPGSRAAAQFVEITVELAMDGWSYWFRGDERGGSAQPGRPAGSVFVKPAPLRFIVGTNMWNDGK